MRVTEDMALRGRSRDSGQGSEVSTMEEQEGKERPMEGTTTIARG